VAASIDSVRRSPYDVAVSRSEIDYAVRWAILVMALTCVPYAVVWYLEPRNAVFPWILFNSDDQGVYYAWVRQAHDGHLLFRNLFTSDPQRGIYLHVYFLALGWLARVPWLGVAGACHVGRVVFGIVTLVLVYRLGAVFTSDVFTRQCIFWTTAMSAGVGWLFWSNHITQFEPVDVWQPEAFTFPSLYTNGLFCVSMALMLGIVLCLLLAEEHDPGWRWALGAGGCGLLLGNIHTYDLIHLAAAWGSYLVVPAVVERRLPLRALGHAVVAALVAAPAVLHMYWFFRTEPTFAARVETETLTPLLRLYLLGYGALIPLAICGAYLLFRRSFSGADGKPDLRRLLPPVWAVAGLAIAYVPVAFQRKLVMGEHIPLALLAGIAVAELCRLGTRMVGREWALRPIAGALIGMLAISNVRYLVRDVQLALSSGVTSTGMHPVYWDATVIHAYEWLGQHSPPDALLLTFASNGVMAPAYSGRTVYAGHWAETPYFQQRLRESRDFYRGDSATRRALLERHGITYVLESPIESSLESGDALPGTLPVAPLGRELFLRLVFRDGSTSLFQVDGRSL